MTRTKARKVAKLRNLLIRNGMRAGERFSDYAATVAVPPRWQAARFRATGKKGEGRNISDKFEGKSDETTTLSYAQFRACALAFGAWIASFQDVLQHHEDLRQPNYTS